MSELQQFFHMGGYASYVWTSFALTALVLLANIIWGRRQLAKQKQRAKTLADKRQKA